MLTSARLRPLPPCQQPSAFRNPSPSAADVICERSLKGNNIFLLFVILNGSLILRYSMSKTLTISVGERSHMVSARFWQILPPLPLSATVSIERPPLMTSAFSRSPPFQSDISFSKNPLHSTLIETLNVYLRGRLQRTSGKWGGGVVLKFRTFPDGGRGGGGGGGGVVCESSDVRKFLKKSKFQNFSELFKVKLEIIIYRYSNMRAFTYDVCSNLGVSK